MNDQPKYPVRKSPRLKDYDYALDGMYFLTLCTQNRQHLFGRIEQDTMYRNPAGEMIVQWWSTLPEKYPDLELDLYVVMPNHFHGIVAFMPRADTLVRPYAVPDVMKWFKTMTTNAYIRGVREQGWTAFPGKLWQRSYHDRIVRHEAELNSLREYVLTNPARWTADSLYALV